MVEQFGFDKESKMLDMAMQRKAAADQSIDQANAALDRFATSAITGGVGAYLSSRPE